MINVTPVTYVFDPYPIAKLYRNAFDPLADVAVQRHTLTEDEITGICHNHNITKWLATNPDGGLVGIAASCTVDHWPLIEPAYFARRWPDQYKRGACWYIGYVATRRRGGFNALIEAMMGPIRESRGMACLDYSTSRVLAGLPQSARRRIATIAPLDEWSGKEIDAQHYYTYTFDWPDNR